MKLEPSISNEGQILCLILEFSLRMVQGTFFFRLSVSTSVTQNWLPLRGEEGYQWEMLIILFFATPEQSHVITKTGNLGVCPE